jgi:hypothetical protein
MPRTCSKCQAELGPTEPNPCDNCFIEAIPTHDVTDEEQRLIDTYDPRDKETA